MTTTAKLWLGFGTMILFLALSAVVTMLRVQTIQKEVSEMAGAKNLSAEVRQLEIKMLGHALNLRIYLQNGDPMLRELAEQDAVDIEAHLLEYERLSTTGRQREMAGRFSAAWSEFRKFTQSLAEAENRQAAPEDLVTLLRLRMELQNLIDKEMRADAVAAYVTHYDEALSEIRNVVVFGLMLLFAGTAIAVATSWIVSRGIIRSEREVANGREQLRIMLASIGDAVIATDVQGRVVFLNEVAESLTGWNKDEATGQPLDKVFRIINEKTREEVENPASKALREGTIVGLANHTIIIAKDGTERPIDDSAAPIRDGAGSVVGVVLVFHDVTERRRAEQILQESEARKSAMFETALDCIVSIDQEGRIIEFNAAAERTFGYEREEVLGRDMAEVIIPPANRERHYQGMAHYLDTGEGPILNQRLELSALRADGVEFPVELTVTRIPVDGPAQFTAYLRDITVSKKAEESLVHQKILLESLAESVLDGILIVSPDGRMIHNNRQFQDIWNFPREVIETQSDEAALQWAAGQTADPEAFLARVNEVYGRQNEPVREELQMKDGRVYERFGAPIRNGDAQLGWVWTFRDITERKVVEEKLRQSGERFRLLADSMSQLAWTADAKGWIYWYNQRWYDYTGTTLEEMQGWGWKKVHHPGHVDRVVARIQHSWDTGEVWEDTFPLRGKDGQYRWFLSRALPIRDADGNITQWFGTNTDVTAEREMGDELRQLAADLSEADHRKNDFLAMLAHELRNPLAPISNALEIMRLTGEGGKELRSASDMMERQVGHLVRLVDDLLDVSRITRGKIELRTGRIELASLVNHAVEAARPSCKKGGVELEVTLPSQPICLHGDPTRLTQIIGNLLNNSCKFTDKGGRIDLIVEREDKHAVIRVRDTGIGIAKSQLPHVFDMFVQADTSLQRADSGLGIGLTLVKNLVELHSGAVSVSSEGLGKGSEFTVRLPVADEIPAVETNHEPVIENTETSSIRRILVVDDNVDSASSLVMLMKLAGHEVQMAHDGIEAVEAAEKFRPHVILLDIGLPKLNGYEAARKIRQLPLGNEIILVALTGWGQEEDRRKSKESGFNAHLVKPVDHSELRKILDSLGASV